MRNTFHADLDQLSDQLVEMSHLVARAIVRATVALLEANRQRAESVIAADIHIDAVRRDLDDRSIDLLARQQPVATDLRTVVTSIRMSADLERMGDLALHVAKVAVLRHPDRAVPIELQAPILQMGKAAERIATKTGSAIANRDVSVALELDQDDDEVDRLHRQIYSMLRSKDWRHGTGTAVDLALLARYYERFADHGVSVARRVVYLVTGEWHDQVADVMTEHSMDGR